MTELLFSIPNGYWIVGLVIASFWLAIVFTKSPENEDGVAKGLSILLWMGFIFMVIFTYPPLADKTIVW